MLRVAAGRVTPAEALRRFEERTVCQLLPADVAIAVYLRECLLAAGLEPVDAAAGIDRLQLEVRADRDETEAEATDE